MVKIFSIEDRKSTLDYILSTAKDCPKIVSLVQVGSGAEGFHDEKSDLDFVIAYDNNESMTEVMDYMHNKISEKYNLIFFTQSEEKHLQVYVLDNFLEIDIGFGCYEHAAVAIKRNNYFRTVGELEFVRKIYIDLLGDRYKLESAVNREIDNLPDYEKEAIKSTYITDDSRETLWACLVNLTDLIYKELEGSSMPISKEMLVEYYNDLK